MQKNIRFIAIDDDLVDLLILKEYSAAFPFFEHAGSFTNTAEGLAAINSIQPDLVFLDIEMPGNTGLEILRQIKEKINLSVFITSHPEFALDGFELSAIDYILKPLTAHRFAITAGRIEEYWTMKQKALSYEVLFENESLTIKDGRTQIKLPQKDIIYLEAMQDYTKVVTAKKNYLTLTTLTGFLDKLQNKNFLRVHRSYAVSVDKISEINSRQIICGNATIPVGKTYRSLVGKIKI